MLTLKSALSLCLLRGRMVSCGSAHVCLSSHGLGGWGRQVPVVQVCKDSQGNLMSSQLLKKVSELNIQKEIKPEGSEVCRDGSLEVPCQVVGLNESSKQFHSRAFLCVCFSNYLCQYRVLLDLEFWSSVLQTVLINLSSEQPSLQTSFQIY